MFGRSLAQYLYRRAFPCRMLTAPAKICVRLTICATCQDFISRQSSLVWVEVNKGMTSMLMPTKAVMMVAVVSLGLCSCAPVLGVLALGAGATAVGVSLSKHPELLSSADPAQPAQSKEISSAAVESASVQQIR